MTLHHESGKSCPLCQFKCTQADPRLTTWFQRVKAKYENVHISWSYRGAEDQELFFKEGKTELHFPHSEHNKSDPQGKPCSRALDLFLIDEDGSARFPSLWYAKLNSENELAREPISWGGRFKRLGDLDHFELSESQKETQP